MIDTNQINQLGDAARDAATQVKANWPAITAAAFIVAREIGRFNAWLAGIGAAVIQHGGIIWIVRKLFWNPPATAATQSGEELTAAAVAPVQAAPPKHNDDKLDRVNRELEKENQ